MLIKGEWPWMLIKGEWGRFDRMTSIPVCLRDVEDLKVLPQTFFQRDSAEQILNISGNSIWDSLLHTLDRLPRPRCVIRRHRAWRRIPASILLSGMGLVSHLTLETFHSMRAKWIQVSIKHFRIRIRLESNLESIYSRISGFLCFHKHIVHGISKPLVDA